MLNRQPPCRQLQNPQPPDCRFFVRSLGNTGGFEGLILYVQGNIHSESFYPSGGIGIRMIGILSFLVLIFLIIALLARKVIGLVLPLIAVACVVGFFVFR